MPLVTADDLRAHLQDASLSDEAAERAIATALALAEGISGQTFGDPVEDRAVMSGHVQVLTLPRGPLLTGDTYPIDVADLSAEGDRAPRLQGRDWFVLGDSLVRTAGLWGQRVEATWWRGRLSYPPGLAAVILSAAGDLASNPTGARSEAIGDVSVTWSTESLRSRSALVASISSGLAAIGLRRPGAFSIVPS